jgi:hypothetical protein
MSTVEEELALIAEKKVALHKEAKGLVGLGERVDRWVHDVLDSANLTPFAHKTPNERLHERAASQKAQIILDDALPDFLANVWDSASRELRETPLFKALKEEWKELQTSIEDQGIGGGVKQRVGVSFETACRQELDKVIKGELKELDGEITKVAAKVSAEGETPSYLIAAGEHSEGEKASSPKH